jgi:hypothetical protein
MLTCGARGCVRWGRPAEVAKKVRMTAPSKIRSKFLILGGAGRRPADSPSGESSRLKGGCSQNWPPYKISGFSWLQRGPSADGDSLWSWLAINQG